MTLGGTTTGTNATNYNATFTLKDTANTWWSDGTTVVKTVPWTIGKYDISGTKSTIASLSAQTYTGSAITPSPSVTVPLPSGSTTTLTVTTDYTNSYTNNTNAGTATITVSGKGNYTGSKTTTFTINKKTLAVPSQSGTLTYNAEDQQPSWNNYNTTWMTLGGTTTGTNATNYNATFTLKDTANTWWSDGTTVVKTVPWTIDKYDLSNATIKDVEQKEYEYNTVYRPEPTVTVPLSGTTTLAKGTDFNYSYSNYDKIGTATITVTATDGGNYKGTKSSTFTIADTTKPVCKFESWVPSEIVIDETAAITLTCTDYGSLISPPTISTTDFSTSNVDILMVLRSDDSPPGPTKEVKYTITVQGKQAGTGSILLNSKMVSDVAGNIKESVTSSPALTVKERELSCTISYEKSSNKILQVKSPHTGVRIRSTPNTSSTSNILASVNAGAQFPYIPSTESTNGCDDGWKKILYNKTTEAYICGEYTEELDYSSETYTDNYYKIIDLKINASGASNVSYSFDGKTYSSVNTLPTITSGTTTAYIKNSNGEVKSCSIIINSKLEYRKKIFNLTSWVSKAPYYSGTCGCSSTNCFDNCTCEKINGTAAGCSGIGLNPSAGDTCYYILNHKTRTYTGTSTFGEWTTEKLSSGCSGSSYYSVETRTRYGTG